MNKFTKCAGALLLSAGVGLSAYGKAVDENTARTVGYNFLNSTYKNIVQNPSDLVVTYVATEQIAFGVATDFYVFNIQGGIGFVMVSGDDRVTPVLACSNESSFDFDKISPNAKYWIKGYQDQITYAVANNLPERDEISLLWKEMMTPRRSELSAAKTAGMFPSASAHLLTTQWDQEPYYNSMCPAGTPTGCVATSTAQVMKFWNWPPVGCGAHSYTCPVFGVKTADFGNTAYQWTSMTVPRVTTSNTATATLMFHVGVAVNMTYTTSTSGSGAYTTSAESPIVNCSEFALKAYFHYKRNLHGVERNEGYMDSINTAAWGNILKGELDAGRPVLYSGAGTAGGHAWVCDGYNSSNQFHMNWGWSGSGPDGWYIVNYLNPPSLGVGGGAGGFYGNQALIIGIQPDSFPSTGSGSVQLAAHLDCGTSFNSPANYVPSAFSITTKVNNTGTTAFNGDFSMQIFDTLLNYITTMETKTGQSISAGGSSPSWTFSNSGNVLQMVPGYYNVRLMYRATGSATWAPVANSGVFINDNVLVVGNSQPMELAAVISLAPTGTTVKASKPITVSSKVVNNTSGAFTGSIQAVFTNVVTAAQTIVGTTAASIFSTFTNSYSWTGNAPSTPGMYTVAIQHKANTASGYTYTGADYFQNPVLVNVVDGTGVNTPSAASEKISVFPNPAKDIVNINMDNVAVSRITITDIQGHQVQTITPDAGQAMMTANISGYATGIYFVNLFTGSEVVTKKIVITK
jgi:hypothetical protein